MTRLPTLLRMTMVTALLVGAVMAVGCTKYASPDDLKRLDEAKAAALSAEKELEQVRAERRKVEQELAAEQRELERVKADLDAVKAP